MVFLKWCKSRPVCPQKCQIIKWVCKNVGHVEFLYSVFIVVLKIWNLWINMSDYEWTTAAHNYIWSSKLHVISVRCYYNSYTLNRYCDVKWLKSFWFWRDHQVASHGPRIRAGLYGLIIIAGGKCWYRRSLCNELYTGLILGIWGQNGCEVFSVLCQCKSTV